MLLECVQLLTSICSGRK